MIKAQQTEKMNNIIKRYKDELKTISSPPGSHNCLS